VLATLLTDHTQTLAPLLLTWCVQRTLLEQSPLLSLSLRPRASLSAPSAHTALRALTACRVSCDADRRRYITVTPCRCAQLAVFELADIRRDPKLYRADPLNLLELCAALGALLGLSMRMLGLLVGQALSGRRVRHSRWPSCCSGSRSLRACSSAMPQYVPLAHPLPPLFNRPLFTPCLQRPRHLTFPFALPLVRNPSCTPPLAPLLIPLFRACTPSRAPLGPLMTCYTHAPALTPPSRTTHRSWARSS
jgi:hypothetical protein